jgi:lipoprotein-anchoring transpeptidase ErfK/SrfK
MLRALALAVASLFLFPSMQALAEGNKADIKVAAASEEAQAATTSGTTTYFGSSSANTASKAEQKPKAAAKPKPLPAPTLTASIDLTKQRMVVSVRGEALHSWPISSGVAQFPTPTGTFRPQWTAKMWYSRKYDMSPMPHSVFIHGGVAVHGTYHTSSLGRAASHGCIRLSPANAKTFYNLVQRHGLKMTKVSVFGRPHWRAPAVASRDTQRQRNYAESQNGWFWDSWGNSNSAYAPNFTQKKRGKVTRRKGGSYAYEQRQPRRGYYKYGYGYGGYDAY